MSSPVQDFRPSMMVLGSGATAFLALIGSFIWAATYASSADTYERVKGRLMGSMVLAGLGALLLGVTSVMYYMQNPAQAVYFVVILSCIAIGLSLAALSVAAMTR